MKNFRFVLLGLLFFVGAAGIAPAQDIRNLPSFDCSGTITAGGTSQSLLTSSATRRGFMVMNLSADKLCISWSGAASCDAAGSYSLNPGATGATGYAGGSFVAPAALQNAVTIVGATTGDKFSCTAW